MTPTDHETAGRGGAPEGGLARQIEDLRQQIVKTSNMLGNLSAEVRTIGREQRQERRGLSVNSAAAYVLFVALVASGFYFVYRSQMDRVDFEKATLVREHSAALAKLEQLRKAREQRRKAEEEAAAFYRLSQSGKIHKALKRYSEVGQLPLSRVEAAVFQGWVTKVRNRLGYAAYDEGMKAVGEEEWKRASGAFRRALKYLPNPPHEASLRYYLGVALMKLGSYKEAAAELERALSLGAEKTISREVRYYLGTLYEQLGRRKQAIKAYSGYIKRHPATTYARVSRRRLKNLR